MKNLKILVLLVLTVAITFSCKKDDDTGDPPPGQTVEEIAALFIGTWKSTSATLNGNDDPLSECELMNTITFISATEATAVSSVSNSGNAPCEIENISATYFINNDEITTSFVFEGEEITDTSRFTINTTTLVIFGSDESDEYTDTYTRQ